MSIKDFILDALKSQLIGKSVKKNLYKYHGHTTPEDIKNMCTYGVEIDCDEINNSKRYWYMVYFLESIEIEIVDVRIDEACEVYMDGDAETLDIILVFNNDDEINFTKSMDISNSFFSN